jgi:hypothetical protein
MIRYGKTYWFNRKANRSVTTRDGTYSRRTHAVARIAHATGLPSHSPPIQLSQVYIDFDFFHRITTVRELTTLWAFPLHVYLYKNYNPNHKWEITTLRTLHDLEDQELCHIM